MDDKTLIEFLGGSTVIAKLLKLDKKNGVPRVNNWKKRGIPAAVKLAHPEIFLLHLDHKRLAERRQAQNDRRRGPRRKAEKVRERK